MAGEGVGISDELISLQITSPNVPDLTLIDLPGIARVAVKGQPEDIGETIKRLIRKFVTKQETINLVVVPCNVDIATTEALQMAQEEDPEGERTLGILTKPDLVDKGTEGTVVDIVHNKVIPLTKGYMIVKCRGQWDIFDQVTLNESIKKENAFFKDHPHFSKLYEEGFATIPKLAEKLTNELVHHIQKSLPSLEKQIDEKLTETQKELEKYCNGPPSDPAERLKFLSDKLTDFTRDTLNLTNGEAVKCAPDLLFFPELREEFANWNGILVDSAKSSINEIKDEVYNEAKYRGRELPGFINYKTFENIVGEQIKLLEEPALMMLKTISDVVSKKLIKLAQYSFSGFPNLLKVAKTKIEAIKQDKESLAESMLRTKFKMETIVYSQDGTYSQSLRDAKEKMEEDEETKEMVNCTDNHATLHEMKLHLEAYYTIASKRLADQIPMMIRYMLLQEAASELQRNMLLLLHDKDGVDTLLKEDFDIGQKRESLLSRQERLKKARSLLVTY